MIADVEAGKVKRVIVKDMSRLGCDYLQVGMYTEIFFPEHDVHFIAVNDGVDSNQEDNEFIPSAISSMSGTQKDNKQENPRREAVKGKWLASISVPILPTAI